MLTQLEQARKGIETAQMCAAADYDSVSAEMIRQGMVSGEIVLPSNVNHVHLTPMAVGKGLSTKVNANIGTSDAYPELDKEVKKLETALKAGVHSVMDLSTGGDIDQTRRSIVAKSPVMVGSVPLYQALVSAAQRGDRMVDMTAEDMFNSVEAHCADGIDFITVHCGVTQNVIDLLRNRGRLMDIVSRGGSFMTAWMLH
ncbi:MAG: phosphomethylpyrimidine synthase ThiC, partial [Candidatus Sumerlaeales bacterium]|nr:phosphomethylpyrimidine synthase ThiC [Candidatus Sumerlaeales bacterium]